MQRTALPLLLLTTSACALTSHPTVRAEAAPQAARTLESVLEGPRRLRHEAVASARWQVPLGGLLDLDDPRAEAAGLADEEVSIVLPVHVLRHPQHGVFVVDTGVALDPDGRPRGLTLVTRPFLDTLVPIEGLASIVARQGAPLAGVLITHFHLDHVLGLPDVPREVPIYAGPGELSSRAFLNIFLRGTYSNLLEGHAPVRTLGLEDAPPLGPVEHALDFFGDGSLFALLMSGHTRGSVAYLAITQDGPILITGDTSHTRWGYENGVPPGEYSEDHEGNSASLSVLRAITSAHPDVQVYVGHEIDGMGTGVGAVAGR